MGRILLPSRSGGTADRRRGRIRLPTAADVPQQSIGRDPGLRVPDPAPTGLDDVAGALSDVAATIAREAERQQKQFDATKTGETELAFDDVASKEFQRRQTEDDPSRPDFMADFDAFLDERQGEALANLPEDVSPTAKERLRLRLGRKRIALRNSAGRLSLKAAGERAQDTIGALQNQWVAQAEQFPDQLTEILATADDHLRDFSGVLTPDAERDQRAGARGDIVKGALLGLAKQGRGQQATALLRSGEFDADLSADDRKTVNTAIESATKVEVERATNEMIDASPSFTGAMSRLATGNLEGTRLGTILGGIDEQTRTTMTKAALNTARTRLALHNDLVTAQDNGRKRLSDSLKAQFYEETDYDTREDLLKRIRTLGAETPENLAKLADIHNARRVFATRTNPNVEVELRKDIIEGRAGLDEIEAEREQMDESAYKEMVALWRTTQRAEVANSMRLIDRELDVPEGMIVFNEETLRLAQKSNRVKGQLQRWLEQNPEATPAEIREQRDTLLEGARKGVDAEMAEDAKRRIERIGKTIPGFDMNDPEGSLERLLREGRLDADDSRILQMQRALDEGRRRGVIKPRATQQSNESRP